MAVLANSIVTIGDLHLSSLHRDIWKPTRKHLTLLSPSNLSLSPVRPLGTNVAISRSRKVVCAGYREGGGPSSASVFVGAFVLGGLIVGTLGCVYAPQISKALAGADRKDLMRKLPKFLYDEEKALEVKEFVLFSDARGGRTRRCWGTAGARWRRRRGVAAAWGDRGVDLINLLRQCAVDVAASSFEHTDAPLGPGGSSEALRRVRVTPGYVSMELLLIGRWIQLSFLASNNFRP